VVKVSDFGLSKLAAAHVMRCHTGCGTAGYAAPEILRRRAYDGRADVFSVGVIAHILLAGVEPFTGDNDAQTARLTCEGLLDFGEPEWEGVSATAMAFVGRCLAVDPTRRPTAAQALEDTWLRGESRSVPPTRRS